MGTVYRARHTSLNRTVAIKILKAEYAQETEVVERFMREAKTMARLRHKGACVIFDAGQLPDGRPFMVMEYVEGKTLSDVLAEEGKFAPARAVRIAIEICAVLEAAHACGIIHRDLKPSNIMLGAQGVSVLDFGIAKVFAPDADATRTFATTDSGILVGTPRYMSPEQCTGEDVSPASDLYGVGVLLYEMLAGRPPFTDALATSVLIKQATQAPTSLGLLRPELPRALVVAVHKLLAKKSSQRPRSAAESARLLEQSLRQRRLQVEPNGEPIAPFAMTVRTLGEHARFTFNRIAALALMSTMLGTVFVGWSRSNAAHSDTRNPPPTEFTAAAKRLRRNEIASTLRALPGAKRRQSRVSSVDLKRR